MAKKQAAKPAKKAVVKKAAKKVVKKVVKKVTKRKPNEAFMKPLQPDDALAAVVGKKPLPRTQITKKVWEYIKKNKLQDSQNRRNINADDNLKVLFGGKKQISMFELTKIINKHAS